MHRWFQNICRYIFFLKICMHPKLHIFAKSHSPTIEYSNFKIYSYLCLECRENYFWNMYFKNMYPRAGQPKLITFGTTPNTVTYFIFSIWGSWLFESFKNKKQKPCQTGQAADHILQGGVLTSLVDQ